MHVCVYNKQLFDYLIYSLQKHLKIQIKVSQTLITLVIVMKILVCFQDFITNTFTYTLHTNGFFIYFLKHLILVLRASKHKLNFLASSSCWHLDLHFHHVFTRYNQLLSSCIMNFLLLGKHLVFLFTLIFEKKKKTWSGNLIP